MDGWQPGSSVNGILQARILEWVAMPTEPWAKAPNHPNDTDNDDCQLVRTF